MGLDRRLRKLESRTAARMPAKPPKVPTTLDEIHALEKEIAAIETEMRAAGMTEAEIRAAANVEELTLDEELEAIEAEIARLETEED